MRVCTTRRGETRRSRAAHSRTEWPRRARSGPRTSGFGRRQREPQEAAQHRRGGARAPDDRGLDRRAVLAQRHGDQAAPGDGGQRPRHDRHARAALHQRQGGGGRARLVDAVRVAVDGAPGGRRRARAGPGRWRAPGAIRTSSRNAARSTRSARGLRVPGGQHRDQRLAVHDRDLQLVLADPRLGVRARRARGVRRGEVDQPGVGVGVADGVEHLAARRVRDRHLDIGRAGAHRRQQARQQRRRDGRAHGHARGARACPARRSARPRRSSRRPTAAAARARPARARPRSARRRARAAPAAPRRARAPAPAAAPTAAAGTCAAAAPRG